MGSPKVIQTQENKVTKTRTVTISSTTTANKRRLGLIGPAPVSSLLVCLLLCFLAVDCEPLRANKRDDNLDRWLRRERTGPMGPAIVNRLEQQDQQLANNKDELELDSDVDDGQLVDEWLPLNESLQLLLDDRIVDDNELVVKRPPPPAAAAAAAETKHEKPAQETEIKSGNQVNSHQRSSSRKRVRRLLVRQLTSLIMNNEPEQIAENIGESTRVSGQILSETSNKPAIGSSGNDNDDVAVDRTTNEQQMLASMDTTSSEIHRRESSSNNPDFSPTNENNNNYNGEENIDTSQQMGASFQEDQPVTCPPDYEDMEAASGGGADTSGPTGNLTTEQRQQILSDSLSFLTGANGSDLSSSLDQQTNSTKHLQHITTNNNNNNNNQQLRHQLIAQCYHQGLQRIEFIVKVITPILFSIIIVVGLLGNIIVMLVILEDRKTERELTPTNLLILDLSLADLSFIIFCIPFTAWDYAVSHWVFGPLWCKFNQYLIVVCALSSIYTLVLMSIDRFMAIVYPIECISYRTSKNMLHAICIKWIIILLIALPTWKMHGLIDSSFGPDHYDCRLLADQYNPLHFQIIFFITSYLFPLILIFCLYFGLLNKLWFGTKPHGHKESHKMLESKKKVTWLVAGIVIVFALCWCPIQVMLILMRLKAYKITPTYVALQVFSHTLGYMNSCVNPIVYAFASETFHQSFKRSYLGRAFNWLFCTDRCSSAMAPNNYNNNNNNNQYGGNTNNGHSTLAQMNSQTMLDGHLLGPVGSARFMSTRLSEQHQPMSSLRVQKNNDPSNRIRNQSLNHIFGPPSSSCASSPINKSANNNNNNNNNNLRDEEHNSSNNKRGSLDNEGSCCTSTLMMTTPHHSSRSDSNNEPHVLVTCRQQPLALEPRDRPTMASMSSTGATSTRIEMNLNRSIDDLVSQGTQQHNGQQPTSLRSQTPTGMSSSSKQAQLVPRQPTAARFSFKPTTTTLPGPPHSSSSTTTTTNQPAKQQLVAQMVGQSSTNGNQQVAHRCEPIEQP